MTINDAGGMVVVDGFVDGEVFGTDDRLLGGNNGDVVGYDDGYND